MSDKTQILNIHSFQQFFACSGSECYLTCCDPGRWYIYIEDQYIEYYNNLKDDFGKEVRDAIDYEKSWFKSKPADENNPQAAHQCALLTSDGLCKLVLKYGDEALCHTCKYYPRNEFSINGQFFAYVDISCPVVAEYLFDESVPMYMIVDENIPFLHKTGEMDENIFSAMLDTENFLSDIILGVDGYNAGKCYLMLDIAGQMQAIIDAGNIDNTSFNPVFEKYGSSEVVGQILEECESFNRDIDTKAQMFQIAMGLSMDTFELIQEQSQGKLSNLTEDVKYWANVEYLKEDLNEFYKYRDEIYPKFLDRYLAYRVQVGWINQKPEDFLKKIKLGYYVGVLEMICAMSFWKNNEKEILVKDFSYIISSIERDFFHSINLKKAVTESIEKIEKDFNYSIFMMPLY